MSGSTFVDLVQSTCSFDAVSCFRAILAVFCVALGVKLMDDFLDEPRDSFLGTKTTSSFLGRAAFPYAMLMLAFAVALKASWAVSLFLASYSIGMFGDLTQRLPTKLKGYQESVLVFVLSSLLVGYREAVTSFLLIVAWNVVDDLIDRDVDQYRWGHSSGPIFAIPVETKIALVVWLLAYVSVVDLSKTIMVSIVAVLIETLSFYLIRLGCKTKQETVEYPRTESAEGVSCKRI